MTALADMTREEVREWLSDYADEICEARAAFVAATEIYAAILEKTRWAFEYDSTNASRFVSDVKDRADGLLAEELRERLEL